MEARAPVPAQGVVERIGAAGLLPVVVLDDAAGALPLAGALLDGGLDVAEVTFRTSAAAASIARIREGRPGMLVGAGTVTTPAQLADAASAGAMFVVTPGFNPRIVARALEIGLPVVPGVNAPGFVEMALEFGLDVLKFFPAEPSGGVGFLKALGGPYPDVRFVPTGGIGVKNLAAYLALRNVVACGGSWMVDPGLIAAGNFAEITRLTRGAVDLVAAARPPHQQENAR